METSGENAIVKKNIMKVQKILGVSSTLVVHGLEASSSEDAMKMKILKFKKM